MKNKKYIILVICAILVGVLIFLMPEKKRITKLERPKYGDEEKIYNLVIDSDGNESNVTVTVNSQKISDENLAKAFDETFYDIYQKIKGKNADFNNVKEDLNFIEKSSLYGMSVNYYLDNYDVIDGLGHVKNETLDTAQATTLNVELTYGKYTSEYQIPICIQPGANQGKNNLSLDISNNINEKNFEDKYVDLPETLDGKKIAFYQKNSNRTSFLFLLVIACFVFFYYIKYAKPKKELEKRNKELIEDYSEVVSKLSLLMRAGMSTYNALNKIVNDSTKKSSTYIELKTCTSKIANGMSEIEAYRSFGKRCGLMPYIRLSNLLAQNISKGTNNIFLLLKEETMDAFNEKKMHAKKRGEEAGTKLLFPMIMMLMVVLIVIVVPAFMSF